METMMTYPLIVPNHDIHSFWLGGHGSNKGWQYSCCQGTIEGNLGDWALNHDFNNLEKKKRPENNIPSICGNLALSDSMCFKRKYRKMESLSADCLCWIYITHQLQVATCIQINIIQCYPLCFRRRLRPSRRLEHRLWAPHRRHRWRVPPNPLKKRLMRRVNFKRFKNVSTRLHHVARQHDCSVLYQKRNEGGHSFWIKAIPSKSKFKDQTLLIGSRESFIGIISKTILCLGYIFWPLNMGRGYTRIKNPYQNQTHIPESKLHDPYQSKSDWAPTPRKIAPSWLMRWTGCYSEEAYPCNHEPFKGEWVWCSYGDFP